MTAIALGLCALARPLSMFLMMWFMRRRRDDNSPRPHDDEK